MSKQVGDVGSKELGDVAKGEIIGAARAFVALVGL